MGTNQDLPHRTATDHVSCVCMSPIMCAAIAAASTGAASRLAVEREQAASEFRTALQAREDAGGGLCPPYVAVPWSIKSRECCGTSALYRRGRPARVLERTARSDRGIACISDMGTAMRWPSAAQGTRPCLARAWRQRWLLPSKLPSCSRHKVPDRAGCTPTLAFGRAAHGRRPPCSMRRPVGGAREDGLRASAARCTGKRQAQS